MKSVARLMAAGALAGTVAGALALPASAAGTTPPPADPEVAAPAGPDQSIIVPLAAILLFLAAGAAGD